MIIFNIISNKIAPHLFPLSQIILLLSDEDTLLFCNAYVDSHWNITVSYGVITPLYRAVAAYLRVVRRRKPSSAEGMRGGLFPLSLGGFWGPPPRKFLNFERFYVRF